MGSYIYPSQTESYFVSVWHSTMFKSTCVHDSQALSRVLTSFLFMTTPIFSIANKLSLPGY